MSIIYRVGTSDPPWHCKDQLPGAGRGASKKYKTMKTADIARMATERVTSFAFPRFADDSIHFMWRLSAMAKDALTILEAWNYTPKNEVVWVKYRPCVDCRGAGRGVHLIDGRNRRWVCDLCQGTGCGTPWFGMGRYTRNAHETCIIATRGKMASKIRNHSIRSTLHAPVPWDWETNRPIHSAKPERFYTHIVQKLARGPYVEMFGRRQRPGWTVLGNQVGKLQHVA